MEELEYDRTTRTTLKGRQQIQSEEKIDRVQDELESLFRRIGKIKMTLHAFTFRELDTLP